MLTATLANAEILKNSVGIISEIIDEAVFSFDVNGMSLLSPDRNMVAVVDFKLLSTAFEEYKVDGEVKMGLNLPNLVNILKRIKGTDKITLTMPKNKLEMVVEGSGKRKFEIPIIDIKRDKPPIEQLTFPGKIDLDSSVLEDGIEDAQVVGDSVVFEAGQDIFRLWSKGDTTSWQLDLQKGQPGILSLEAKENMKARYQLEYLRKMAKACKISKQVTIEFGTDYPLRLSFKEIDKVNLNFILAPLSEE